MNAAVAPSLRLLGQASFDSGTLAREHPPRLVHPCKRLVFELAGGEARQPQGTLDVRRYALAELPQSFPAQRPQLESEKLAFDYPRPAAGTTAWHVNFADPNLFYAYGAAAFAQDEMQVAEHPILGSLLEALTHAPIAGLPPFTEEDNAPTPILIRGAERWCAIDTDPDLAMPYGIYGRRFGVANPEVLRQAVTRLDLDYRSNLIVMAAPMGSGRYTAAQIRLILATAFTGFAAARAETPAGQRVRVHTGHWGTGAFGGNRVLMALLQVLAAQLAQVDELVYHSVGGDGPEAYEAGVQHAAQLVAKSAQVAAALEGVLALHFGWGTSDGN